MLNSMIKFHTANITRFTRPISMFVVFLFLTIPSNISAQDGNIKPRPKIGLVLSGGGARGFAHIGTLKLLDSLKIPVDFVAGTSMGGIIGALYSIGYSGKEIEQIARNTNWEEIFSDSPSRNRQPFIKKITSGRYQISLPVEGIVPGLPSGLIKGQKVFQILSKLIYAYQNVNDFRELPIPFSCVAADIVSGKEVILNRGSLALAIRATMSIPTIFTPVEWGDSLLVDGGIVNNLPVDVVKEMGADIVIAVNVGTPKFKREELNSIIPILEQTINLAGFKKEEESIKKADVVITPNLQGFSAASFSRESVDSIIARGDIAAKTGMNACMQIQQKYSLNREIPTLIDDSSGSGKIRLRGISIAGNTTLPAKFIYEIFALKPGNYCTFDSVSHCVSGLKQTGYFKNVKYELKPAGGNNVDLILIVKEIEPPIISDVSIATDGSLSENFIRKLLGVKAGSHFNTDDIDSKITYLYGLDYFETIHYEIQPVSEKLINLMFHFKEKPKRVLNLGLRFDDKYKFVGALSFEGSNIIFPGVRLESELQFIGLTQVNIKLFYPTRTLDFPLYPFIKYSFKDIDIDMYGANKNIFSTFSDRSSSFSGGFGILFSQFTNLELEYNFEEMNVHNLRLQLPKIQSSFGSENIKSLRARWIVDLLDDAVFPFSGIHIHANYENSRKQIKSSLNYSRFQVDGAYYYSIDNNNTFRITGFYGETSGDIPFYKLIYRGGQNQFIGLNYMQNSGIEVSEAGMDYRFKIQNKIYASLAGAAAKRIQPAYFGGGKGSKILYAAGLSLIYRSPAGPVVFTYSRGFNSDYNIQENRDYLFLKAGLKF